MAQILYRPSYTLDALSQAASVEQIDRFHGEQLRAQEREEQRQRAIIAAATVATLGVGLVAAPALGLAGAAGTIGAGGTVPGAGIGATAATSGLLGTGGAVGLAGGLQLAGLGAQIGGQLANRDYAGAITTGTGAAVRAIDSQARFRENQSIYGHDPDDDDIKSYSALATKLGTTLGSLKQNALNGGGTVPEQLAHLNLESNDSDQLDRLARDLNLPYTGQDLTSVPADRRQSFLKNAIALQRQNAEHQAYRGAYQATAGKLDAEVDQLDRQNYSYVPDDAEIAAVQQEKQRLDADLAAYGNSNGEQGASLEELAPQYEALDRRLQVAKQGTKQRRQPSVQELYKEGLIPGTNTSILRKPDGSFQTVKSEPNSDGVAPWNAAPPGVDPAAYRAEWFEANKTPDGDYIIPEGYKVDKQSSKTSRAERRAKFIDTVTKPNEDGEVISGDQLVNAVATWERADHAAEVIGEVMGELDQVGKGTITPERYASLMTKLQTLPGTPDASTIKTLNAIRADAIRNSTPAGQVAPQGPATPEQIMMRAREIQIQQSPEYKQAQQEAIDTQTRAAVQQQRTQEKATRLESLGQKKDLSLKEQIEVANIAAAPNQEVTFIKKLPDQRGVIGRTVTKKVVKGFLTPELWEQLTEDGWEAPGLGDD